MDIKFHLNKNGLTPYVYDPYIKNEIHVKNNFIFLDNLTTDGSTKFDAIIISVAHKEFRSITNSQWLEFINQRGILFDLKGIIPRELNPIRI